MDLRSLIIVSIPFMILNGIIAKRKGKRVIIYVLLSSIPMAGIFFSIYLMSFLDKKTEDKIDEIHKKLCREKE